ncbi:Ig-like domain-containing protein [Allorhizobium undicola]|uniref:Ig-like domain-containing protein n=1 Tax=Allorhizobium undicola TaxID=78527 RepID=UPI0012B5A394|nr:hypothetical protein [Allorhizobium undicola]
MTSYADILNQISTTGSSSVNLADDKASLTLAQALSLASQGVVFASGDTIEIQDAAATLQTLTGDQVSTLKTLGVDAVLANDTVLALSVAQVEAFAQQNISISSEYATLSEASGPTVIDGGAQSGRESISTQTNGDYLIAYLVINGSSSSVFASLYDSDGVQTKQIDLSQLDIASYLTTTAISGGGYVVTWVESDASGDSVFSAQLDASGNLVGSVDLLASAGLYYAPTVTALSDGGYIIVWQSNTNEVYEARYDSSGNLLGSVELLDSNTPDYTGSLGNLDELKVGAVVELGDGKVLVLWNSYSIDGSSTGVAAQIISSTGALVGSAFAINETTTSAQSGGSAATLEDGTIAVSWISLRKVYLRLLDADGNFVTSEVQVSTDSASATSVTALEGGGFVLAWRLTASSDTQIAYRVYDADGNAKTAAIYIDANDGQIDRVPTVEALDGGGYIIVWTKNSSNVETLYAEVFDANGTLVGSRIEIGGSSGVGSYSVDTFSDGGFAITWSVNGVSYVATFRNDTAAATLSTTASGLSALTASDASDLAELGITTITVSDSADVSLTKAVAAALIAVTGLHIVGDASISVTGTGSSIDDFTASEIASLASLGVSAIDLSDDAATLTLAQALAYVNAGISFASGDALTVQLSSTDFSALTSTERTQLAELGVHTLDLSDNAISLTVEEITTLRNTGHSSEGLSFASADVVTLADTSANIAALSAENIATLASWGVDQIQPTDGTVTVSLTQVEALETAGIGFTAASSVVLSAEVATIAALTTTEIAALAAAGVDEVSVDGDISLSVSQIEAFLSNGLALEATDHKVMISDTGANFASLSATGIAALATLDIASDGKIWLDASDNKVTLTFTQIEAYTTINASFSDTDLLSITTTSSELASLSSSDLAEAAALGVTLVTSSSTTIDVSAASLALIRTAGLTFDSTVTTRYADTAATLLATAADDLTAWKALGVDELRLADSGTNIAALTSANIAALDTLGISTIDVTSASATISMAKALLFAQYGMVFDSSDTVIVSAASTTLSDPDSFDLAGLQSIHVDKIDASDNKLAFSLDQAETYVNAGIGFVSGDAVSVDMTLTEAKALGSTAGQALRAAGVDTMRVDLSASEVKSLTVAQIAALGAAGINAIDISTTSTVVLSRAQIAAFTSAGISFASDDVISQHKAPTLASDTATTTEHATAKVSVLSNDTVYDSMTLSVASATVTSGSGRVTVNSDGTLSVTYTGADIDASQTATVVVSYTVTDSIETATSQLTVSFTGVTDTVSGTSGADTITGSNAGQITKGLDGDDKLYGLGGNDTIYGGNGNDTINGGAGNDKLYGEAGNDTIAGSDGNDTIYGGAGDDKLYGEAGTDTIYGEAGNDTISGAAGTDTISGGDGNDTLNGGDSSDTITGDAGNDTIAGDAGNDILKGGAGNDVVHGNADDDKVYGEAGDDKLYGDAGADTIYGGDGVDTISGGDGNDTLYGDAGNDTVTGDAGNDTVYGGAGIDTLYGGAGDDKIYGEAGDDKLYGDAGADTIYGGDGVDTISGGDGNDTLNGDAGNDTITGDAGNDTLHGNAGDDKLYGSAGDDKLYGEAGADTLSGDAGADTLSGGDGNDTLNGGDGNDTVSGDAGDDAVNGNAGDDTLNGGAGADTLRGGAGADKLYGDAGDDKLYGDAGNDTLTGGDGADTLYGGDGNDKLIGGAGRDTMQGGAGADEFVFTKLSDLTTTKTTTDVITDFSHSQGDHINLSAIDANTSSSGDQAFSFIGSAAFTKVAGQLRYEVSDSKYYVYGDVNGDGKADFVLEVASTTKLVASDFIL